MSEPFKKSDRYLVIKRADIDKYLTDESKGLLEVICGIVELGRKADEREPNRYICVNEDEDYAELVWSLIEKDQTP